MFRYLSIAAALIVGIVDAIAFEVWIGLKQGVCAGQPLVPDKLHPKFFRLGRMSFCYVSNGAAQHPHQFALTMMAAEVLALCLLLVARPWTLSPAN